MSEKEINEAILTLDVLIDCTKEDGTYYNAQKEWEALEVFKKLQQENQQLNEKVEYLKSKIENKDRWCQLIADIGFDYDGYRDAKNLMTLIDELVRYALNSRDNYDYEEFLDKEE